MKLGNPDGDDGQSFYDREMAQMLWPFVFKWQDNWLTLPERMRAHPAQRRLKQVIDLACENWTSQFSICSEADMRAQLVSALDAACRAGTYFIADDLNIGWQFGDDEE